MPYSGYSWPCCANLAFVCVCHCDVNARMRLQPTGRLHFERIRAHMKGGTTEIQAIAVATRKLCPLGEITVTSARLRIFLQNTYGISKLQRRQAELIATSDSFLLFPLVRSRTRMLNGLKISTIFENLLIMILRSY